MSAVGLPDGLPGVPAPPALAAQHPSLRGVFVAPKPFLRPLLVGRVAPHLDAADGAYAPVPVWTRATWHIVVRRAYDHLYRKHVLPHLDAGVSRKAVLAVASAMASFADHATGRRCRPTLLTLERITGRSRRVIQRARKALQLLGLARLVVAGRRRTREERIVAWQLGDRARGWAAEFALSIPRVASHLQIIKNGTPPAGTTTRKKNTGRSLSTQKRGRRKPPSNPVGEKLSAAWGADGTRPSWVSRDPAGVSRALAPLVDAGWGVEDLNMAIRAQERRTGKWVNPSSPGGYLRWLAGQYEEPPTAGRDRRRAERDAALIEKRRQQREADRELAARKATPEQIRGYRERLRKSVAASRQASREAARAARQETLR